MDNNVSLPKATNLELVRCVKMTMDNGTTYTIKVDDLVAVQFVKNDNQILVRRGRIKDLVVVNSRELSCKTDNVSRIILDCSEQFTVKIVEIKFSSVIAIGNIDDSFDEYTDRVTELDVSSLKETGGIMISPVRNPDDKIDATSSSKTAVASRGFAITR